MKKLILVIFLAVSVYSSTVWQGMIGKAQIFMSVDCNVEDLEKNLQDCHFNSYFYQSSLQDINFMDEKYNSDKQEFILTVGNGEKVYETFYLHYTNQQFRGKWKDDHKIFPVSLTLEQIDNIDRIKAKFLKLSYIKKEQIEKSKELVWIKERFSKTEFFRLGNGFSKSQRETINPILDQLQMEYSHNALSCYNSWEHASGMESSGISNLEYISDKLLSFSVNVSYDCGGAHPDFYTSHYTFDLDSGHIYKLKEILNIADKPEKIRDLAFEEAGMKLEPSNVKDGNQYDPYDLYYWYDDWDVTEKGIRFYLNFSSAERCYRGDYYEVSFERLKPYLSKDFLNRIN